MKEYVAVVDPKGGIKTLYFDEFPLEEIGSAECERASDVVWDEKLQAWKIQLRPPFDGLQIDGTWKSRKEAIAAEVAFLNNVLEGDSCT